MHRPTEAANPQTSDLDLLPTGDILRRLLAEERRVADALAAVLPELERAADLLAAALHGGGSVHTFGAGSSGRLAALDAIELGPTFGLPVGRYVAHCAGAELGDGRAREAAEDDAAAGALAAAALTPRDVALGVAASGSTPYVAGALGAARIAGVSTILLSCSPHCPLGAAVDVHVAPDTGAEALAGSTRLKAGTATKIALNALSTTAMIRIGRTYSNYMVWLDPANAKLQSRAVQILAEVTSCRGDEAAALLAAAGGELPTALVMALGGVDPLAARDALGRAQGSVRHALSLLRAPGAP